MVKRTFKKSISLKRLNKQKMGGSEVKKETEEETSVEFLKQINKIIEATKKEIIINGGGLIFSSESKLKITEDDEDETEEKTIDEEAIKILTNAIIKYKNSKNLSLGKMNVSLSNEEKFLIISNILKNNMSQIWNKVICPFIELIFSKDDPNRKNLILIADKTYTNLRNIIINDHSFN